MPEVGQISGPFAWLKGERRGWFWLAGLGLVLAGLRGAALLYDHSLHSIDGAMQTWFALHNFADGAKLGGEFQSYLGVTMVLALMPVFAAFGQTLWASSFAAYALVIVGVFAGAYAIAWFLRPVGRGHRWIAAVLIVFAFYFLGRWVAGLVSLPYPASFEPGVSLRPLRGSLAFFVLPVFVWAVRRIWGAKNAVPALWLGLVAGAGLLWSNDAGIPLVIAVMMGLIAALKARVHLLIKSLFAFGIGAAVSAFSLVILVTQGDPSGWLQYNFVDVAGDQFWYFGPWGQEARVLGIFDLPRIFLSGHPLSTTSLILLTVSVLYALIRRIKGRGAQVRMSAFVFVAASVLGTALIPQLGGHIGAEYNVITFVFGMCAPIILWQRPIIAAVKPMFRAMPKSAAPAAAGLAAVVMVGVNASALITTANQTDRTHYADALGFYVTPQTAQELAAMERLSAFLEERGFAKDQRLLSVYTSTLDIAASTKSPSPVGSLIHALGKDNREEFNELLFGKVVAATTIAPDYSVWAGWNTRANWPFFKALRDLYRPVGRTDQHVLWIRYGDDVAKHEASCTVEHIRTDVFEVSVESAVTGTASLFIEREAFDASSRSAVLTVTEDSSFTRAQTEPQWSDFPRYGIANTQISEVSAPVVAGEATKLKFEVLDGSAIGWAQCDARVYEPIDYASLPPLSDGVDQLIEDLGR